MSDLMLIGVLRMPMDNPDSLTLRQFIDRARQAADRIEADAAEIAALRADNTRLQNEVVMPLRERVRVLEAEVAGLEQLVWDAAYTLEGARIWGGMKWAYNPLHPFKYLPMLDRLNVERARINDKRAALAARKGAA